MATGNVVRQGRGNDSAVTECARGPGAGTGIGLGLVRGLYREHAAALAAAGSAQRELRNCHPRMLTQLDDIEAEITYLILRHFRPGRVVEIGSLHGWSTTWILRALEANGTGRLTTIDLAAGAIRHVPAALAEGRWEFRRGDARAAARDWLPSVGYLFIDASHSARFARWYLHDIVPRLPGGIPVSVHDVFHGRRPLPCTEGHELLRWIGRKGLPYFTVAPARDMIAYRELAALRAGLGIAEAPRGRQHNPMLWLLAR